MTPSRKIASSREAAETAITLRKGDRHTSWEEAVRRSTSHVGRWEEAKRQSPKTDDPVVPDDEGAS